MGCFVYFMKGRSAINAVSVMMKIGFDNDKYLKLQSEKIRERVERFGGKLYLEFGGKLFDDYHASRVLPGFKPDSKVKMLLEMKDDAEIVVVINADDIEKISAAAISELPTILTYCGLSTPSVRLGFTSEVLL